MSAPPGVKFLRGTATAKLHRIKRHHLAIITIEVIILRSVNDREKVLNMYFHKGQSYKSIAKEIGILLNTVKSMRRRYREFNGIPTRGNAVLNDKELPKETIRVVKPRDTQSTDARIKKLEMEVDLLRNFIIPAKGE
jgi:transposase-like protein